MWTIVHSAPPGLQALAAGAGGFLNARRGAQAEENRANALVRSNELAAIGGGIQNLANVGLGSYFASQGQTLPALLALAGPRAAGGYIANTSLAQTAQQNRLALQDDAQAFSNEQRIAGQGFTTERDAALAGYRNDYVQNAQSYGQFGASPDYVRSVGEQLGATDPDTAFALGGQFLRQQEDQQALQQRINYYQQTRGAEQRLGQQVAYEYSPQAKNRLAQLSQAQSELMTNPAFTSQPGVLNPAGFAAYQQIASEMAQIRPTARVVEKPPDLAAELNVGNPQGMFQPAGPNMAVADFGRTRTFVTRGRDGLKINKVDVEPEPNKVPEYPKGRGINEIWTEHGLVMTRNADGQPMKLGDAVATDSGQPALKYETILSKIPKKKKVGEKDGKPIYEDKTWSEIEREALMEYNGQPGINPNRIQFSPEFIVRSIKEITGFAFQGNVPNPPSGPEVYLSIARSPSSPLEDRIQAGMMLLAGEFVTMDELPNEIQAAIKATQMPSQPQRPEARLYRNKRTGEMEYGYIDDNGQLVPVAR